MKRLIEWSIAHHGLVLAFSVLLAAAGVWTVRDMPVDVFPDLTAPTVTILTEGRGMAPEEMETLVTFPLEAAMNGASGVRRVRSATAVGIAVVWVEFDWGTDIFQARQVVAEKLALASGAHDLTLPVLWATTTDAGGRFGGTAAGIVNFASSLSGMLAPLSAAWLQSVFGSFHAVFLAAATMYVGGAVLWLIIDPRKSLS